MKERRTSLSPEKIKFRNEHRARVNKSEDKLVFSRSDEELIRTRILREPSKDSLRDARVIDLSMQLAHIVFQFDLYIENATDEVVSDELNKKYRFIEISEEARAVFEEFGTSHEELIDMYGQIWWIRHDLKLDEKMGQEFVKGMHIKAVANLLDSKKQN
jgi:hypothetical protein